MQGLHLTGDLFECGCSAATLTDLDALSSLCRNATLDARLTIVDEKWHAFPDWKGQAGGITGTLLLKPPPTSTLPFASRIALCNCRAWVNDPVLVQEPVTGSYNSAVESMPAPLWPATTRTLPPGSEVAV